MTTKPANILTSALSTPWIAGTIGLAAGVGATLVAVKLIEKRNRAKVEWNVNYVPPPVVAQFRRDIHAELTNPPPITPETIPAITHNAASSILVVVDMQEAFARPDSGWYSEKFKTLESGISQLVAATANRRSNRRIGPNGASDSVVFTRFVLPTDGLNSLRGTNWLDYYRAAYFFVEDEKLSELAPPYDRLAREGNHNILPLAAYHKINDDIIKHAIQMSHALSAQGDSKFAAGNAPPSPSSTITSSLSDNLPTIVVCGVSTDCCVLATAIAAADAGLKVRVVRDACAGTNHERSIEAIKFFDPQIAITTVAEEMARLNACQ